MLLFFSGTVFCCLNWTLLLPVASLSFPQSCYCLESFSFLSPFCMPLQLYGSSWFDICAVLSLAANPWIFITHYYISSYFFFAFCLAGFFVSFVAWVQSRFYPGTGLLLNYKSLFTSSSTFTDGIKILNHIGLVCAWFFCFVIDGTFASKSISFICYA